MPFECLCQSLHVTYPPPTPADITVGQPNAVMFPDDHSLVVILASRFYAIQAKNQSWTNMRKLSAPATGASGKATVKDTPFPAFPRPTEIRERTSSGTIIRAGCRDRP